MPCARSGRTPAPDATPCSPPTPSRTYGPPSRLSVDEDLRDRLGPGLAGSAPDAYDRLRAEVEREVWCELGQVLEAREPVVVDHGVLDRAARERYEALFASHGFRAEFVHVETGPARPPGGDPSGKASR